MKKISKLILGIILALVLVSTGFSSLPGMDVGTIEVQAAKKPAISKKTLSLYVKKTATLKMKNSKGKIKWSSSNKKIAKVSSKGKVTAVKAGKATISAKVSGKTYKCTVTVKNPVLSPKAKAIYQGKTVSLKVTGAVSKITWSSSNKAIAKVSSSGIVTGVKPGKAVITALASGVKLKATITVVPIAVKDISLDKEEADLEVGSTLNLKATITPANATYKTVTWTSSDPSVATVDTKGLVTAVGAGSATITAKSSNGLTKTCTVTTYINETEVTLEAPGTMKIGGETDLVATVLPENATYKAVSFSSSDESILTVDEEGHVKALKDGTATVTVTTNNLGKTSSADITVKTVIESFTMADAIAMDKGKTEQLTYQVYPETIKAKISYSSSNTDVATVDENGLVTALKSGEANITVTAEDSYGNTKSAVVKVNVKTRAESINLNHIEFTLYVDEISNAIQATILPEDTSNKAVSYASSDESIAKVNSSGFVKAVAAGSTTITVTSKDVSSVKASVEVIVKEAKNSTVTNEDELTAALADADINIINIDTQDAINLTIPSGDYSTKSLVINAPKGHIVNNAKFKNITILAISNSTFVENATGNTINYEASNGSIKISEGAAASINVIGDAGTLNLINDGTVSSLVVASPDTTINVSGDSGQLDLPVSVTSQATNTGIKTSADLAINTQTPISLNIENGGQNTRITVDSQSSMPTSVTGLGKIQIKVQDTNTVETVVADSSGTTYDEKYAISGIVKNSSNEVLADAKVYVIPYSSAITPENIAEYASGEGIVSTATDENGSYTTDQVSIGNYYIYITKEDYVPVSSTLILINASDAETNNFTMVTTSEGLGSIDGKLIDAESGRNADQGLTVYLRRGSNNTSGNAITSTTTDKDGSFTFTEIEAGQYTIQVVDQREEADGYYVTAAFDIVVVGGENNSFSNSITKILSSDQVRFVLSWGDEASGASSDLDSHLLGPTADGAGQFHTYYGHRSYYDSDVTYADLDVDDTDYEGPETTTIYVNTKGTYSFYIHDYTNSDDTSSDQMSRSSAVVKAYIGSKLMATYNCPNKAGNLWYVCDYDSTSNKFTAKNIVSGYDGSTDEIGIDLLARYRGLLSDAIKQLETEIKDHPTLEIPEEIDLEKAKKVLEESEDYQELREQYYTINNYLDDLYSGLYIDDISMYEQDSEDNLVTNYWVVDDDNDYNTLIIKGLSESLCEDLRFEISDNSTYTLTNSDREGFTKMLVIKNQYGIERSYYISYEQDIPLGIGDISAGYDEDENEIIRSWSDDYYISDEEDGGYYYVDIQGILPSIPESLEVIPHHSLINVDIVKSDKTEFEKMIVLSYKDLTRTYYINYEQYVPLGISNVTASNDADGNDIIYDWNLDWDEDEDENEYNILFIQGLLPSLPENLVVTPNYSSYVTAKIEASDKADFEKMVVLSWGENTRRLYIRYEQYVSLSISNVDAGVDENDNELIDAYFTYLNDEDDEDSYYILEIYGLTPSLPENTKISATYSSIQVDIKDSDKTGFEKMVVLSYEEFTKTYYIEYIFSPLLGISSVSAGEDENGNRIIDFWDWDYYYDDDDNTIYYLTIEGLTENLPEDIEITPSSPYLTAKIVDSDMEDYDKMVQLVVKDTSTVMRTYYIRYTCIAADSESSSEATDDESSNSVPEVPDISDTPSIEEDNTEAEEVTTEAETAPEEATTEAEIAPEEATTEAEVMAEEAAAEATEIEEAITEEE